MNQFLWITRWNDKRKDSAVAKQKAGLTFLSTYTMEDFKRVLYDLWIGLQMNEGSKTSRYVTFIPPKGNEVIKIRLSDHPSSPQEWIEKELTGLPNRRYSIVIFSKKSMPNESKQGIKELEWKNYIAQNIPTYEKTFNRYYLNETFETLKEILLSIYKGGCPEDNTIKINLAENNNRNMNKKLIKLTESDLHRIVKESVNNVLTELDWKTYQNAAKKAHLKSLDDFPDGDEEGFKYGRKSDKFRRAAEDAFKRDYGVDDGRHYSKLRSNMHGSKTPAPGGGYFPFQDDSQVWIYDRKGGHTWGGMKFDQAIDDIAFPFEKSYMKKDTANKHEKAMKELDDYQRGRYKYDKEKGWHK